MNCLIIAAGMGSRMSDVGSSKPLIPLLGKALIIRIIESLLDAGVLNFYVVIGYKSEKIKKALIDYFDPDKININFIYNEEWEKQNGISVLKAKGHINGNFFLTMSDHIFDKTLINRLKASSINEGEVKLAIDKKIINNDLVDLEDVTKVLENDGNIVNIGKNIDEYNAFDTGFFYCTHSIFDAIEESTNSGDSSLSGGMRILANKNMAKAVDIKDSLWIDVDNKIMLKKAEKFLKGENYE